MVTPDPADNSHWSATIDAPGAGVSRIRKELLAERRAVEDDISSTLEVCGSKLASDPAKIIKTAGRIEARRGTVTAS
jgi:hypothetical protein